MTVIPRRTAAPVRRGRGKPAPLSERFKPGTPVAVYEDYHDPVFAGRFGTVVSVSEETDHIYPRGRIEVRLKVDELYERICYRGSNPPKTVWFKPNDLEKL